MLAKQSSLFRSTVQSVFKFSDRAAGRHAIMPGEPRMPLFAVIGFDDLPRATELRANYRAEHRAFFKAHDNKVRFAGAFYGDDGKQCGTFVLFEAADAEEIGAWYSNEPFYKAGVYKRFEIVDFRVALSRIPAAGWDPNFPPSIAPKAKT
jgi:uncharacterized protein YciI